MSTGSRLPDAPVRVLSRRRFLGAGVTGAGALVLAGCGDDGSGSSGQAAPADASLAIASLIPPQVLVEAAPARLPFGLTDVEGMLPPEETPPRLEVQITGPDGTGIDTVEVQLHDEGLPRGYYPLVFETAGAGIYTARTDVDGEPAELTFQVHADEDLELIRPGQSLPALATPTVDDDRGVTPICTREPACPLHDVTLEEALGGDQPIALLVATPAFCQSAICGPVLDVLLESMGGFPGVRFVHAEVYRDPFEETDTTTEAVQELGLPFEPCLVMADRTGTVTGRLDTIYDRGELRGALRRLERTGP